MRSCVYVAPLWLSLLITVLSRALAAKCPRVCVCDHTKLTVACTGKNLSHVPPTIDEITVKLDLKKNNLRLLSKGSFQNTPYLTHLTLHSSKIHSIQEGAFRGLGRLVQLDLTNNNIEILYQECFDGLSSLKQLLLDRNRIEEIQPGAFMQLGSLNMLSLTQNQLVYLPNLVFQGLLSLQWLKLSHNALSNLATEALTGMPALTRLSLEHNELQFFPTQPMSRLTELTRLELSFNPMTYLGEESVSMPKLRELYLDRLSLQDLSDSALLHTPLLTHLDLSHNQLHGMEPPLGPAELERLNLTGNPLLCTCFLRPLRQWARAGRVRVLGSCLGPPHLSDEPLEEVKVEDLRCRRQESVREEEEEEKEEVEKEEVVKTKMKEEGKCPDKCLCEPEAQYVSCEEGGLSKIPRGFPDHTLLLDLHGNHLRHLPSNSFHGVSRVISLHLKGCMIREIDGGAFRGMKELIYLYLSENELTSLDTDTFTGAPEIMYLHLEDNKLTHFPSKAVLEHIPNLLELHLERNLIAKLEPAGLLSPVRFLRGLFLTSNVLESIDRSAFDPSPHLEVLHLGANKLAGVPSDALSHASQLTELRLSGNPIRWVGKEAFLRVAGSLKHLFLDGMGLEGMSQDSLAGLGHALVSLSLEQNQLELLPDLNPLSSLELITITNNTLLCDCNLLQLRRWMERTRLEVSATCVYPPELRGQNVLEINIF